MGKSLYLLITAILFCITTLNCYSVANFHGSNLPTGISNNNAVLTASSNTAIPPIEISNTEANIGIETGEVEGPQQTLVLVDGFTEYISGECRQYCQLRGIKLVELLSPYMCEILQMQQGCEVPDYLRAPIQEDDIYVWAQNNLQIPITGLDGDEVEQSIETQTTTIGPSPTAGTALPIISVLAESDSGVSTAEKLAAVLGLPGNGMSPHLRNKFKSNQRAEENGLGIVKQKLAYTLQDALEFVKEYWTTTDDRRVVVKPYRGVASDGVYLCTSLNEVESAFNALFGKPKYGGGANDAVLIQEFADGQEYAVDTVAMDGDIKVVALWKYHKQPMNGAPFVYQCSQLIACQSEEERAVCDYCIDVLKAQDLKWGPTHTEIRYTSNGPRLIEINARWHAQNFVPIVRAALGYDAVTATLDAFFDRDRFRSIPDRPLTLSGAGRILHLISHVAGTVKAVNHVDEIQSMESTIHLSLDPEIGSQVVKTVDIRTDCGYVLQYHSNPEKVEEDFDRIVELQSTLFDINSVIEVSPSRSQQLAAQQQQNNEEGSSDITNINNRLNVAAFSLSKLGPLAKTMMLRVCLISFVSYVLVNVAVILIPFFVRLIQVK